MWIDTERLWFDDFDENEESDEPMTEEEWAALEAEYDRRDATEAY
jgi:hypothetical protein